MALPRFAKHTATVITPTTRVVNGLPRKDYGPAASREEFTRCCWATPGPSEEDMDLREHTEIEWTILFPPRAKELINEDSHVEYDGTEYSVVGRPKPVPSPTGRLAHLVVSLKTWEG